MYSFDELIQSAQVGNFDDCFQFGMRTHFSLLPVASLSSGSLFWIEEERIAGTDASHTTPRRCLTIVSGLILIALLNNCVSIDCLRLYFFFLRCSDCEFPVLVSLTWQYHQDTLPRHRLYPHRSLRSLCVLADEFPGKVHAIDKTLLHSAELTLFSDVSFFLIYDFRYFFSFL